MTQTIIAAFGTASFGLVCALLGYGLGYRNHQEKHSNTG
jgi:hypothetical protein